jgi:hypothetical protein
MVCVNQTRPHCVNQMGKTQSKPLAERHGMCESAFSATIIPFHVCIVEACPRIHWFSIRGLPEALKRWKINKRFLSFKRCAKRELAVTWWNPAAQTRPVLDSSSFLLIPTLLRRTCLHSPSSVLAVNICCRVIALFVFRKPLFIN